MISLENGPPFIRVRIMNPSSLAIFDSVGHGPSIFTEIILNTGNKTLSNKPR